MHSGRDCDAQLGERMTGDGPLADVMESAFIWPAGALGSVATRNS
jgi:hypothetical protein